MEKKFCRYKWVSLLAFGLMYNLVYLGRFNVNQLMEQMTAAITMSAVQQEMLSMSVFISYAAGSFINGFLADRWGAKKTIILGGTMSALLNVAVALQSQWTAVLVIWLANGYFQSMIWVGGIGLLAHWWDERERGKGIGIANFFSGMSHATAYLVPLALVLIWPQIDWRWNLAIPVMLLLVFVGIFAQAAVQQPQEKGLTPYTVKDRRLAAQERSLRVRAAEGTLPWKYFFSHKDFWWWCAIAALSSICRYGLINWIPLYYNAGKNVPLLSENFSNLTLPIGMAFGTLLITWAAGTKWIDNKGIVVTAMAAVCAALVVLFPMLGDTTTVLIGIFFTGFALYGINGILWLHAIDQGGRVFPGSAAGILNGFAYLGACLESVIFPAALRIFHDMMAVFILMEMLCICMVICGMVVSRKNTVIVPEIRE